MDIPLFCGLGHTLGKKHKLHKSTVKQCFGSDGILLVWERIFEILLMTSLSEHCPKRVNISILLVTLKSTVVPFTLEAEQRIGLGSGELMIYIYIRYFLKQLVQSWSVSLFLCIHMHIMCLLSFESPNNSESVSNKSLIMYILDLVAWYNPQFRCGTEKKVQRPFRGEFCLTCQRAIFVRIPCRMFSVNAWKLSRKGYFCQFPGVIYFGILDHPSMMHRIGFFMVR